MLIQDSSSLRGKWKMAKVSEALESVDGKVRHVKLIYTSDTGVKQEIERPIQRLILLVPSETVAGECSACQYEYISIQNYKHNFIQNNKQEQHGIGSTQHILSAHC